VGADGTAVSPAFHRRAIRKILAKSGIPIDVAKDHSNRIQIERDEVRFLSMHNAKGWSSPAWQSAD
jgi:hypothetical protein